MFPRIRQRKFSSRAAAISVIAASLTLAASEALAVACAGGNLDFNATSNLPVSGTTFNVGQQVDLAAIATGFTATSFAWSIDGPAIKDYQERLGNAASGPLAWSTAALTPADLGQSSVRFYWKPSPSQIHPSNTGPSPRSVALTVQTASGPCTLAKAFQVERNETDANKQPVDYYTSNHRNAAETNTLRGVIIDDHRQWHLDSASWLYQFLPWHGRFLARYQQWRAEFGYAPVEAWNPGTPLPTGVDHQHVNRLAVYNPNANLLPPQYSLAAGASGLAAFPSVQDFSDDFEGGFHGDVHCNIGPSGNFGQPSSNPSNFGSMCTVASPKDPMFWRWHLFIDVLYRNSCALKGAVCDSGPDPTTDVWMADNAADLAAGGTEPSPSPHWLSVDIWNRHSNSACTPATPNPGFSRDCGSSADHENPVAGSGNYLYATLRNDRPGATKLVYAEVAVYIANASTGLAWPADFNGGVPLPETRKFLTLSLEPGQSVDIGPLDWDAPNPSPSDHFCLYVRILTVQDGLVAETANVDQNTAADNSIAWRNLNIVPVAMALSEGFASRFIVRNWRRDEARIDLVVDAAQEVLDTGEVRLQLAGNLLEAWKKGQGSAKGLEFDGETFLIRNSGARLDGLMMGPREEGAAAVRIVAKKEMKLGSPLVSVRQLTDGKEDGGVDVALSANPSKERGLPDLIATLEGPMKLAAGKRLHEAFTLTLANKGEADAPGTVDNGPGGYGFSAALWPVDGKRSGNDMLAAPGVGVVVIGGGDILTPTLRAGENVSLPVALAIPKATPSGRYCLLVTADDGNSLVESNESNNEYCFDFEVAN